MRPVPQGAFDLRVEADRVELSFPGTFLGPTRFVFDRTRNLFERNGNAVWPLDRVASVEVQATWMGPSAYHFMLAIGSADGRTEHLYVDPRKPEVTRVAEAIARLVGLEVTFREQPFQRQLRERLGIGGPRGSGAERVLARGDPDASAAPDTSPSPVSPGPRRPDLPTPTPASAGLSSGSAAPESVAGPRLVVVAEGPLHGRQFALRGPTTVIGRSIASDIVLETDSRVAYRHARVHHRADDWTVEDVPGSGGTSLNGERLAKPRRLSSGDVIGVRATQLRFERD
jgi:hypothetical protein